ncbi:hypothetical protein QRQ56_38930 [Bradyrhizobium sp. U531]|uniref:hypothetical protein n=1 Tax=Bradyrhizobium sp. U531 TaxID=3053458 RepID=UPI003F423FAA
MLIFQAGTAFANDDGAAFKAVPAIYLDLRTIYAQVPAGSLAFGFGRPMSFNALLARLNGSAFPNSVPAAKSLNLDVPLTIDVTDSVSLYAGVSGNSTEFGGAGWSSLQITSWNIGFQADVYQQNGGPVPTVTLQSTFTQSIPNDSLATTSFNSIIELDYAFNLDEIRSLLAGFKYTATDAGNKLVKIKPNTVAYIGAYYQWSNNWKFTGRAGVQSFEGAQLLHLASISPLHKRSSGSISIAWTTTTIACLVLRPKLCGRRSPLIS